MSLSTGITPQWGYGVHPKVILHSKTVLQDFSLQEELCAGLTTKYAVRRTEDEVLRSGPPVLGQDTHNRGSFGRPIPLFCA